VPPNIGFNCTDTGTEKDNNSEAEAEEPATDKETGCAFPSEWTLLDLMEESEVQV